MNKSKAATYNKSFLLSTSYATNVFIYYSISTLYHSAPTRYYYLRIDNATIIQKNKIKKHPGIHLICCFHAHHCSCRLLHTSTATTHKPHQVEICMHTHTNSHACMHSHTKLQGSRELVTAISRPSLQSRNCVAVSSGRSCMGHQTVLWAGSCQPTQD